ncbi:MAG: ribonuclease P protein subunit [Thermoprotei archaeon]|nr:MAG: ribonuclease P protein subunit [Thermoprotei archaeon]
MKITPRNLPRHELIGLRIEVIESPNSFQKGIRGEIIFETMNTLIVDTPKGRKVIPKKDRVFKIWLPDGIAVLIEGNIILGRPEDRLKKKLKDW